MKSFGRFILEDRPIYIRRDGELSYDLSEDVFDPNIRETSKEKYLRRLKEIREAALPKGWKGMRS